MISDTELLELYQRAQNAFTDVVDGVESAQWDDVVAPGRTVVELVTHLTDQTQALPDLLAALPGPALSGRSAGGSEVLRRLGGDPLGEWESAADAALAVLAAPGALEGTVQLSRGVASVRTYVEELITDLVSGALDLARATGQDDRLDPALLARSGRPS